MKAFAKSDVGKLREINEDYYYISKEDDPIKVYILADGMGGYNGGEVASKLATATALSYIQTNFDKLPNEYKNNKSKYRSDDEMGDKGICTTFHFSLFTFHFLCSADG